MNIIVRTYGGHYVTRPDTTWEKDNEDFFPPDFTEIFEWTPVVFARVCKPGRSIGGRFVRRYYDRVGYGVLLYPADHIADGPEEYAEALTLDHTSFLPDPKMGIEEACGKSFSVKMDCEQIFDSEAVQAGVLIDNAVCEATKRLYIRTGDIIAVELAGRMPLCTRSEGNREISGIVGSDAAMSFRIRFV
ncbi:MAG: hypothetical protein ACI3ZP_04545 [Candidatus Cryptobacteroides sp.]